MSRAVHAPGCAHLRLEENAASRPSARRTETVLGREESRGCKFIIRIFGECPPVGHALKVEEPGLRAEYAGDFRTLLFSS